jgi:beta-galactosidase/beta-glucuronidase
MGDSMDVSIPAQRSLPIRKLNLTDLAAQRGADDLMVWLTLEVAGKTVSRNLVTLVYPKNLKLVDPQLKTAVKPLEHGFNVTVSARHPALWTWLELEGMDARYSDNFVHVRPGASMEVRVTPGRSLTLSEFNNALRTRSLADTYMK